jgi:hypothetical protein
VAWYDGRRPGVIDQSVRTHHRTRHAVHATTIDAHLLLGLVIRALWMSHGSHMPRHVARTNDAGGYICTWYIVLPEIRSVANEGEDNEMQELGENSCTCFRLLVDY